MAECKGCGATRVRCTWCGICAFCGSEPCRCDEEAAEAAADARESDRIMAEIEATPIEQIEAELREAGCDTDNLTKQTRTVVRLSLERNKAVREKDAALEVLRELVAACHKCANCESPAMRKAANEALYCDTHGYYLSGTQMDDHRIAAPLRAALALLAADQAGEKAGKP